MTEVFITADQIQFISYALSVLANGVWFMAGLSVFD